MKMQKKIVIAAVATAALGLSACGGGTTPDQTPVSTTVEDTTAPQNTTAPEETTGEETTQAAPEETTGPAEPAGDFPFEEGPVDTAEFVEIYSAAMAGVDKLTIISAVDGSEPSTTQVDNSDPANPRSYTVMDASGQTMEVVTEGTTSWTRIDEGEWTESTLPDAGGLGGAPDASAFKSVELVNKAEREFTVVMDMSSVGGTDIASQMWFDEQFRVSQSEMEIGGVVATTTFDYDSPVEIPAVS